jgi:hypothetical protein
VAAVQDSERPNEWPLVPLLLFSTIVLSMVFAGVLLNKRLAATSGTQEIRFDWSSCFAFHQDWGEGLSIVLLPILARMEDGKQRDFCHNMAWILASYQAGT